MTHGVECNYQPPVLHKPRIGIVPNPFLVKAVWLRETSAVLRRHNRVSYVYVAHILTRSPNSGSRHEPPSPPATTHLTSIPSTGPLSVAEHGGQGRSPPSAETAVQLSLVLANYYLVFACKWARYAYT